MRQISYIVLALCFLKMPVRLGRDLDAVCLFMQKQEKKKKHDQGLPNSNALLSMVFL